MRRPRMAFGEMQLHPWSGSTERKKVHYLGMLIFHFSRSNGYIFMETILVD